MAKQSNLQLYRGQGVPPTNSMLAGEIAMDTDKKVLWINNGQAIKPVGIIEGGTTPPADYAGTLWIDNNASPTGIPADFLVANNLTTQTPGAYVLDAYQGKILKDALDAQQLAISAQADQINNLSEDFIVERGTEGIWTYEKWASGKAICWGVQTETGSWATWGNIYSYDMSSTPFPNGLFIEAPFEIAQMTNNGGNAVGSITSGNSATNSHWLIAIRGTSLSGTYTFSAYRYAIGKWK